jgi:hypothetical protein
MLVIVLTAIKFRAHTNGEFRECELSKKSAYPTCEERLNFTTHVHSAVKNSLVDFQEISHYEAYIIVTSLLMETLNFV